jgi:DNA gyrase inhibitor GyrI
MKYEIPKNAGKVRVMMTLGGKYAVWNGKDGKAKFEILTRTRKQAEEVARKINTGNHGGEIDVSND